jgi:hypothetical protein
MNFRLNTFLCYSSYDKPSAQVVYKRLSAYTWIRPWLVFGSNWEKQIENAVNGAHVVIIFISKQSFSKQGYLEDNVARILKLIEENHKKLFRVIALRLDESPLPESLQYLIWRDYFSKIDYFSKNGHEELINYLSIFGGGPSIYTTGSETAPLDSTQFPVSRPSNFYENLDWHKYINIPATTKVNYSFSIRKFHITNEQYMQFLNANDYAKDIYWINFPKFDENCNYIGNWGDAGLKWVKNALKNYSSLLEMRLNWYWSPDSLGENYAFKQPNHPAVNISWYEANAYCKWFSCHWRELPDAEYLSNLITSNTFVRLPLETEFHVAVKYDNLSRTKIDPTLRLYIKRHQGLSLDISTQDMLANCYGRGLADSLIRCDGYLYIDEYTRDLARVSYYGSFQAGDDYHDYGFRLVLTESK